jgi:hypothetical protein
MCHKKETQMSDGNFNRQLLPKTELSSGLRAGRAQMRTKAEQAFAAVMSEDFPDLTDEQRKHLTEKFNNMLRK